MPHGYSDSEWARMKVQSVGEITREKVRELQGVGPEEVPVIATPAEVLVKDVLSGVEEIPEVVEEKVEEVKPAAKKRGRPAKLKKLEVEKIVIPEVKKTKKTKRGKR